MNMKEDQERGLILMVDLDYPEEIHDRHNQYPLAVEKMKVDIEKISHHQKDILDKIGSSCGNGEKLIGDLNDKKNHVIHYRNLQQCISLGMKLKRIHKVVSFEQSKWLKQYIDLNTKLRTESKSNFEMDFYKMMNNAVFGKTMENVRNTIDFRFATTQKQCNKYARKNEFNGFVDFPNEEVIGV